MSPYKGLSPFEDSDHDASFFFGRDREQEIITANLTAARLTLLYGASGVGKSSVLRAAVARRLRELPGPLAVVLFDQWRDEPGARLREAVAAAAGNRPEGSLADTLDAASARLGGELYVILDGAEEYFVYHAGENEPGTFAGDFPDAVARADLRANFLLALREDSLAALDPFKARIPSLFANSLRLDHLDRDAARAAIVGPLEELNRIEPERRYTIEPELVEAVLAQVARGKVDLGRTGRGVANGAKNAAAGYVETPYLSLVMERLWESEREQGSEVLRLRTLDTLGGAEQIVRDHLDDALAELPPDGQEAAAAMFDHLVTPSGTKIAHRVSDLEQYAGVAPGSLEPTLHTLTSERILRPAADANGSMRYEIFHDVLADAVLAWRAGFATQREVERERSASHRRMLRVLIAAGVVFVAMITMAGIAIFALAQRSDAQHQRNLRALEKRQAVALALSAGALSQLDSDPETSLLFAANAARREPTAAVANVLRAALIASHVRSVFRTGAGPAHAAVSPSGRLVAVGGGDGRVTIFRVDGTLVRPLPRHRGAVTAVVFAPTGDRLLTADADRTVRIWRVSDGSQLHAFRTPAPVAVASFNSSGNRVVTVGSHARVAGLWTGDGRRITRLTGHTGRITSALFNPVRPEIVTASADGTARVWDGWTGRLLYSLVGHKGPLTSLAFSPDGSLVVTGSANGTAGVWSGSAYLRTLPQGARVLAVAFSPRGSKLATAGTDGKVVLWDTGRWTSAKLGGHAGALTSVAFDPSGRWLVTASDDQTARVWKVDTAKPWTTLLGHGKPVTSVRFDHDGYRVISAGNDGTVRIWDAGTRPQLAVIGHTARRVNRVAFSPQGTYVVAASDDGTARIWRTIDGKGVARLDHGGRVTDAVFSPNGKLVLAASTNGTAVLWADDGARLRTFRHEKAVEKAVNTASFSSDGSRIVTGSDDGTARIWRLGKHRPPTILSHGAPVVAAAFSPDGRRVLTAGDDGVTRIWRADGTPERRLFDRRGRIVTASFSHDGTKVVTASRNHTGVIWDARTGTLLHRLEGNESRLTSASFSPDDRTVLTTSLDPQPRIFSVATGSPVALRGHLNSVPDAAFSPDGRWIVTAGPSSAGLFEAATGVRKLSLYGDILSPLTTVAFSSDGVTIAAGSADGLVRAYRCNVCGKVPALLRLAEQRLDATGRKLTRNERATYLRG